MALAKNPALLAARQNLESVRALELQAEVRQNPYVSAGGSDLNQPTDANNPYGISVGVRRLIERGQKRVVRNALVIAGTLFGLARFLPKGIDPMIVVISLVASVMVGVLASIRIASGSATSAVDAFEEQMMERYRKRSHKKRR